jgi:hypothetical protein
MRELGRPSTSSVNSLLFLPYLERVKYRRGRYDEAREFAEVLVPSACGSRWALDTSPLHLASAI